MLVLSRKNLETIVIGDIVIRILGTHGNKTRVGVEAPADVKILRGELVEGEANGSGTSLPFKRQHITPPQVYGAA